MPHSPPTGREGLRRSPGSDTIPERLIAARVKPLQRFLRGRLQTPALGLLSAGLLWGSFPEPAVPALAWVALVPLVWSVWSDRGWREIYLSAWLSGLAFFGAAVHWLRYTDATGYFGWWGLAFYLSVYFPLFLLLARLAVRRGGVPVVWAVPIAWVGLEWFRAHFLTGFAWYFLGHTQYQWLALIQVSDVTGAYGVSFLVALANAAIAQAIRRIFESRELRVESQNSAGRGVQAFDWRRLRIAGPLGLAAVPVIGALVYGHVRLAHPEFAPGPKVALLQSNIPQRFKEDPAKAHDNYRQLLGLLAEAKRHEPDLIVWPETSWPYIPLVFIAPETPDAVFESLPGEDSADDWRHWSRDVQDGVKRLAADVGRPMLVGALVYDFGPKGLRRYNSAVLVGADGEVGRRYDKLHLVAFGEYLPLAEWMPWLHVLTPYETSTYSLDTGTGPVRFSIGRHTFSAIICFEDTVPQLVRRVAEAGRRETKENSQSSSVDFLVNMTNDGWFGGSSELDQHLAISVFRAIECRRPLVRAVNTGISAIIDGDGKIVRRARDRLTGRSKLVADVVVGNVPLDVRKSAYLAVGDSFAGVCAALAVVLSSLGIAGERFAVILSRIRS